MNSFVRYLISLLLPCVLLPQICWSDGVRGSKQTHFDDLGDISELLPVLVSTNRQARINAAVEFNNNRQNLISALVSVLKGTNYSAKTKVSVVVVLGEYRASEAVPILVENLALDSAATGMIWNALLPREEFEEKAGAVSIALQKIGSAAIPTLLDKLRQTDDENEIEKCVRICAGIDGVDVAQFRLKQSLIDEVDQARRGRIQHALVVLTKVQTEYIR